MAVVEEIVSVVSDSRLREPLARALASSTPEDWRAVDAACQGRPGSADQLLAAALKARELRHAAHETLLAAALALSPWHVDANLAMARSYLGRGLARQAHVMLSNVRKHRGGAKEPEHAGLDEMLLRVAQAAGMGEDARAAAYRLAINTDSHWEGLLAAADFFRAENDLDAQRTLFARMIKQRPDDPDANVLIASWLHDEGYDKEAQKHIERAIATARSREQRVRAQRLLFEIKFPEDDAEFRKLTESFFATKPRESLPVLKRLTRKHPALAEAWLFLGFALRRDRQLVDAINAFERCVKLTADPNAHKELGALYGEINEPRLAVKHARQALELLGEHDRISWINLGAALCELRRLNEASTALSHARDLDPHSPQVSMLEQSINARQKPSRGFYNARMVRL
jgi:tetratricopeptide (TPR) repeat protein